MKKLTALATFSLFLFSCNSNSDTTTVTTDSTTVKEEKTTTTTEKMDTAASPAAPASTENKNYTIAEFTSAFKANKDALKGTTATVTGYFLNKSSSKNQDGSMTDKLTLYPDEKCNSTVNADQVTCVLKNGEGDKKIFQYDKIKVMGKVEDLDIFGRPQLVDVTIIK